MNNKIPPFQPNEKIIWNPRYKDNRDPKWQYEEVTVISCWMHQNCSSGWLVKVEQFTGELDSSWFISKPQKSLF